MKKILFVITVFVGVLFYSPFSQVSSCKAEVTDYLQMFEDKVTEFTLENGLNFLVIERHQVPIVSFVTFVDVGSVNEKTGQTGISHMLEHMAFKGTKRIGTRNWEKEKQVLQEMEQAYKELKRESSKSDPDSEKLKAKRNRFQKLKKKAGNFVKPNEFSKILEKNGANNLNAGTTTDATLYFNSLPANRAELWFNLESDRLMNPVFREFYTEKDVVLEERRMRVESNPTGKLIERLQAMAYLAHPYGQPVIGWRSDIELLTKSQLRELYNTYYVPQNITIAVAGDINPEQVKKWAKLYFGPFEKGPEPPKVTVEEPEQEGRRSFKINSMRKPVYVRAYHAVNQDNPDFLALDLLASVLSRGRTSLLYSSLVQEKRLAAKISAFNGFPGTKFPSLFAFFAVPNAGVELSEIAEGIDKQLQKVKDGEITAEELERAKTKARASLVRRLDSNMGLAKTFAKAQGQRGDWKKVFTDLEKLQKVSLEDIQKVAEEYLSKENSIVGKLVNIKPDQNILGR